MIARFEMTHVSNAILSILKLGFFGAVPFAYFSILKKIIQAFDCIPNLS